MCDSVYTSYISQDGSYSGSLCRICKIEQKTLHAFRVRTESENIYLHEMYTNVTGLEISEDDELPLGLCLSCCDRLSNAYFLKKQALLTYKSLSAANPASKVKTIEEESDICLNGISDDKREGSDLEICTNLSVSVDKADEEMNAVQFLTQHRFFNSVNLEEQSSFDLNDKKHECLECGKKFARKSNLTDHLRLHANVKLFKCEYCPKSFVQIGNLRTHSRIHTKKRPFSCHICPKTYNQSSALKIHIRSHTNERNYICDICSKAFTNKSDLNKHKLVHDVSKHAKCKFCNRFFAQKSNLRHHQKKVHMNQQK